MPDFTILKYRKDRYYQSIPEPDDVLVVIEVSETTYDEGVRMDETDKEIKLPIYASSGIPLYWIVNLPADRIEVYSDSTNGEYKNRTIYYPGEEVSLLEKTFEISEILVTGK